MRFRRIGWLCGAACGCLAMTVFTAPASATSTAIGASGGNGPETTTQHPLIVFSDYMPGWKIGSSTTPQEVYYDPNQGPWVKQLNLDLLNNMVFTTKAGQFTTSINDGREATFRLKEHLVVSSGEAWTDWHEHIRGIVFPDDGVDNYIGSFTWESATIKIKRPSDIWYLDATDHANVTDEDVWFNFDPLPVGTEIKITKELDYYGTEPLDNAYLEVAQYPTVPTPSAVLAGMVLLGGFACAADVT